MKQIIPIVAVFLMLVHTSCKQEILPACEGDCPAIFYEQAQLAVEGKDSLAGVEIVKGKNRVFKYRYFDEGNPLVIDDESTYELFLEVDDELSSFQFSGEELVEQNAVLYRGCYCAGPLFFRLTGGEIEGTQLNAQAWQITGLVEAETEFGTLSVTISDDFVLTQ